MMRRVLISVFVCFLAICSLTQYLFAADLKLGVNAPRGELNAKKNWTELAKYLSGQLGQTVTLVTLHPSKVVSSAMEGEVDFILSHASHTINLQERHGSTLTVESSQLGFPTLPPH